MGESGNEDFLSALPQEIKDLVEALESNYWVPALKTPFEALDEVLQKSSSDCPALHPFVEAFSKNLISAKDLLEFPYFLIAPFDPAVQRAAAQAEVARNGGNQKGAKQGNIDVIAHALQATKRRMRSEPVLQLLMHQACLLIWGALESFVKRVFIAALNERPSLYTELVGIEGMRERFGIQQSAWPSLLESHDFNLHGNLGFIVGASRDFSAPRVVHDMIPALFSRVGGIGFPEDVLNKRALWLLGQRRHLVAHRCGIVDREYLDKAKDDRQEEGHPLKLRGRDIAESLGAAASYAILLYGNARYCWKQDG